MTLPRLSDLQKSDLDRPITSEEIMGVIKGLPSGKAPGPDGFTAKFFKCYVSELTPFLLSMYNEAFVKGELPDTLSKALITLILKKDKDPCDCKIHRPISLIPLDTKILSKVLANRLEKVMTSIVHEDQVGFIHKRNSADNIRCFINIMWAVSNSNSPIAAVSLDAEKAFDRVEWRFLFRTLEIFGFGGIFTKWVHLLYKQPEAAVQTNGYTSPHFELGRGTRQGSPLSPLLFCLVMEPLAAAIMGDDNFPGVTFNGSVHKSLMYADDILLLVSDPMVSIPSLLNTINTFSKFSGYKVNWDKSEALPLTKYCPTTLFQAGRFKWPTQGLKYLGILFPPQFDNVIKVNFDPLIQRLDIDVKRWSPLYLSLWGKVNVIKLNCVPRINYLLHSLPLEIPNSYFKRLDSLFKTFLWNGKRARMNMKKLQRPVNSCGLGFPNVLYYRYAFSLRHLAHWALPPESAPPWYNIEQSACAPLPFNSLLVHQFI